MAEEGFDALGVAEGLRVHDLAGDRQPALDYERTEERDGEGVYAKGETRLPVRLQIRLHARRDCTFSSTNL